MYKNDSFECCGINELCDLQGSTSGSLEQDFKNWINEEMFEGNDYAGPAVMIFSTTQRSENGDKLKALIEKKQLGDVMRSRPRRNPNTENMVTVFTWGINKKNLRKYWLQECLVEDGQAGDVEDDDEFGN